MTGRTVLIKKWQRIVSRIDPDTGDASLWQDGPPDHFLHAFRPDGVGLAKFFAGMPRMVPVLGRLKAVFKHAGAETGHLYFVVSRPKPMSDAMILRNAKMWLKNCLVMAETFEMDLAPDLEAFLINPTIVIGSNLKPMARRHPFDSEIYQIVSEFGDQVSFPNVASRLLVSPLYMLATSYELAYWILSPVLTLGKKTDPFSPWARLWLAGIKLRFEGEGDTLCLVARRIQKT